MTDRFHCQNGHTPAPARSPPGARRPAGRADARPRSAQRRLADARRLRGDAARDRAGAHGSPARIASRWSSAAATAGAESIALEVPGPDPSSTRACSKRRSIPGAGSASGTFRCSGSRRTSARWCSKSSAAALQLARAGLPSARPRRDGAAPLIGSTAGHAGAALDDRARRRHRLHGAARRRKRRRQGAGRPPDPRAEPAPERAVRRHQLRGARRDAARSRAVRHRGAHGHRRPRAAAASSSTPTAARCSSTRSRICRCRRRPSCCGPSRIWPSSGSAATAPTASTSGSSRRPTAACPSWSSGGCFGPTCSIG